MATTESRPGFRLPWTSDHAPTPEIAVEGASPPGPAPAPPSAPAEGQDPSTGTAESIGESETMEEVPEEVPAPVATAPRGRGLAARSETADEVPGPGASRNSSSPAIERRRSHAFLAELARAMHAAALEARERVLDQFRAESKSFVEGLHARSAEEIAALRKAADEDIAGIRDWSKAEIARIREETERRIAERKAALEEEIEAQAARIERQIERLQGAVAEFEAEMDRFFSTLLAVEDPTEFAALAANLPEPPPFDEILAEARESRLERVAPSEDGVAARSGTPIAEPADTAAAADTAEAAATTEPAGSAEPGVAVEADETPGPEAEAGLGSPDELPAPAELDEQAREAAFAAIEAAARAAAAGEAVEGGGTGPDLGAPAADADLAAPAGDASTEIGPDVEPATAAAPEDELDHLDDAQIAARLGLLDTGEENPAPPSEPVRTQIAVVGLVSVASIAGFKRQLTHLPGVRNVSVASGPNGEFLFAVSHDPDLDLAAVVPELPGFGARVTGAAPGSLAVTARDPDLTA